MTEDIRHMPQQRPIDPGVSAIIEDTGYAAHFMIRFDKSKHRAHSRTSKTISQTQDLRHRWSCNSEIVIDAFDFGYTEKLRRTNGCLAICGESAADPIILLSAT
jgi:hypothetical protein